MKILTDEDVMVILDIKDKRTLRKYRRERGLNFLRIGKTYRYSQEMIDDFVRKNSSIPLKMKIR